MQRALCLLTVVSTELKNSRKKIKSECLDVCQSDLQITSSVSISEEQMQGSSCRNPGLCLLTSLLVKGERKDKGLLPTPLNILDKNNDCVNLTLTYMNLFLHTVGQLSGKARNTPFSRSTSVRSSDCM